MRRQTVASSPKAVWSAATAASHSSPATTHEMRMAEVEISMMQDPATIEAARALEASAAGKESMDGVRALIERGEEIIPVRNVTKGFTVETKLPLSDRQRRMVLAGGLINMIRDEA